MSSTNHKRIYNVPSIQHTVRLGQAVPTRAADWTSGSHGGSLFDCASSFVGAHLSTGQVVHMGTDWTSRSHGNTPFDWTSSSHGDKHFDRANGSQGGTPFDWTSSYYGETSFGWTSNSHGEKHFDRASGFQVGTPFDWTSSSLRRKRFDQVFVQSYFH
jgi:hypothetical protein